MTIIMETTELDKSMLDNVHTSNSCRKTIQLPECNCVLFLVRAYGFLEWMLHVTTRIYTYNVIYNDLCIHSRDIIKLDKHYNQLGRIYAH